MLRRNLVYHMYLSFLMFAFFSPAAFSEDDLSQASCHSAFDQLLGNEIKNILKEWRLSPNDEGSINDYVASVLADPRFVADPAKYLNDWKKYRVSFWGPQIRHFADPKYATDPETELTQEQAFSMNEVPNMSLSLRIPQDIVLYSLLGLQTRGELEDFVSKVRAADFKPHSAPFSANFDE